MNGYELPATIILIVLVVLYLKHKSKKEKDSGWTGELIKKKDYTDEDNENHSYRLIFKTSDGQKKKVTVSEEVFNKTKVGDKYEKNPGETTPKKIS